VALSWAKEPPFTENVEWVEVPIIEVAQRVIGDLPHRESRFCRSSPVSVIIHRLFTLQAHSATCADFFLGRYRDYQTLNLTFAANVAKYGAIIGMFPKPLKLYVIVPIRIASFTRNTLQYCFTHAI
jgi:hypothetical protein